MGQCWVCGAQATSADVTSLPGARRAIALVSRGGDQGAEAEAWLRDFRRPLESWRMEKREVDESEDENSVWNILPNKRSRTDQYRMNLAKEHFGNPTPYDPKVNLSFHGFRRFGGDRKKEFDRHKTLPLNQRSFQLKQGSLEPRKRFVKKYLSSTSQAKENSLTSSKPKNNKLVPVERVTEAVKKPFIDQIKHRYGGNFTIKDIGDMNLQFDKYVEGFMEARELVALFSGKEEQVGVREDLAEFTIEAEKHVGQYDRLYGATESIYNIKPR